MLDSVWAGSDRGFLRAALPFYLRRSGDAPITILDASWGRGGFWLGMNMPQNWRLAGLDRNPAKRAVLLGDWNHLPLRSSCVEVVVWDPPHVVHPWSFWDQAGSYSTASGDGSIAYLYPGFLTEAYRVLVPKGIVMAKIADQIHSYRQFFQTAELLSSASQFGFTACDLVVKVRAAPRPQPEGRRQLHARRRHSFWVALRKGLSC